MKKLVLMLLLTMTQITYAAETMTPASILSNYATQVENGFKTYRSSEKIVRIMVEGLVISEQEDCPACPQDAQCEPCMPSPKIKMEVISGDLLAGTMISIAIPYPVQGVKIELKTGSKYIVKLISVDSDVLEKKYYLTSFEIVK